MVPPDPTSEPPQQGKPPAQRFGRLLGRPRLSTLLLAVNLILLIAPLSGVFAMRLYESALLRQTESALLSQGIGKNASSRVAVGLVSRDAVRCEKNPVVLATVLDLGIEPVDMNAAYRRVPILALGKQCVG